MTETKPTPPTKPMVVARQMHNKAIILEQLQKAPIVQIACEKTGISRATYYRWRKEDDSFAHSADEAIAAGVLLINDMAESQLLSSIRDQNMTAIIFWLKNRHPAYTTKLEVTPKTSSNEPLTDEQEEAIRRALSLASFPPTQHGK